MLEFGLFCIAVLTHRRGHLRRSVPDVDLTAGDVVAPSVQGRRLGQPGDRMLGRRVRQRSRARRVGGDRAVVDDAPAPWLLPAHHPEGLSGAQKGAGEVDVHHGLPLGEGDFVGIVGRGSHAGVVEEQVHPAVSADRRLEQLPDRGLVGHISRHRVESGRRMGRSQLT